MRPRSAIDRHLPAVLWTAGLIFLTDMGFRIAWWQNFVERANFAANVVYVLVWLCGLGSMFSMAAVMIVQDLTETWSGVGPYARYFGAHFDSAPRILVRLIAVDELGDGIEAISRLEREGRSEDAKRRFWLVIFWGNVNGIRERIRHWHA